MSNELDYVAWAAGFFDGEGCVAAYCYLQKEGYLQYDLTIQVGQVELAPLRRLEEMWGGHINVQNEARAGWRRTYCWKLYGRKAASALTEMIPYLTVKKEQAELFVRLNAMVSAGIKRGRGQAVSEEEKAERADIVRNIALLKTRVAA